MTAAKTRRWRRPLVVLNVAGGLVLLAIGLIACAVYRAGKEGSSEIERWMGQQINSIAGTYLKPEFSFSDLDD